MKYNEVEARLEVVMNCMLGDILADFNEPEDGDFDYENCTSLDELALHLSDMVEAHVLDSDEMLEFHEVVVADSAPLKYIDVKALEEMAGVRDAYSLLPCCDHEHEPHFCTHEDEVDGVFVQCKCEGIQ